MNSMDHSKISQTGKTKIMNGKLIRREIEEVDAGDDGCIRRERRVEEKFELFSR